MLSTVAHSPPGLVLASVIMATLGTLGGIGGAVLLVPLLVLLGYDPWQAAPLGMLSVGAGSLAAAPRQLDAGVAHQRLGVTLEIPSSIGAIVGALLSGVVARSVLVRFLAAVALGAAIFGGRRKGLRNHPQKVFVDEPAGEWPGTLAGAYHLNGEVVPYQARRVKAGLVAMIGAGVVSGLAGVGGGFIKTPVMSEIMHVPVKVAAATSTFTVGITSATTLLVFAGQGRIDTTAGAAVVLGGLFGGTLGAWLAGRLAPTRVRTVLSVLLAVVAVVMAVQG